MREAALGVPRTGAAPAATPRPPPAPPWAHKLLLPLIEQAVRPLLRGLAPGGARRGGACAAAAAAAPLLRALRAARGAAARGGGRCGRGRGVGRRGGRRGGCGGCGGRGRRGPAAPVRRLLRQQALRRWRGTAAAAGAPRPPVAVADGELRHQPLPEGDGAVLGLQHRRCAHRGRALHRGAGLKRCQGDSVGSFELYQCFGTGGTGRRGAGAANKGALGRVPVTTGRIANRSEATNGPPAAPFRDFTSPHSAERGRTPCRALHGEAAPPSAAAVRSSPQLPAAAGARTAAGAFRGARPPQSCLGASLGPSAPAGPGDSARAGRGARGARRPRARPKARARAAWPRPGACALKSPGARQPIQGARRLRRSFLAAFLLLGRAPPAAPTLGPAWPTSTGPGPSRASRPAGPGRRQPPWHLARPSRVLFLPARYGRAPPRRRSAAAARSAGGAAGLVMRRAPPGERAPAGPAPHRVYPVN
jgi:hypothetical protein